MLGVSRPTVTIAAGILQKARAVSYVRGNITVNGRPGLETVDRWAGFFVCSRIPRLVNRMQGWSPTSIGWPATITSFSASLGTARQASILGMVSPASRRAKSRLWPSNREAEVTDRSAGYWSH